MGIGVSSLAFSQSLRAGVSRMQTNLATAQKEASTGRVADRGLALGAGTAQSVSLERDLGQINTIQATNALAASRLSATQNALKQLGTGAQTFLGAATVSLQSGITPENARTAADTMLASLTGLLNTTVNGEHIFGGTRTDVPPLNDWSATGSPARQAFTDAFAAHFGFATDDPAAQNVSEAQMDAFLDAAEDQFLGAGWAANWSNATDEGITSRVTLNETAETSIGANDEGFRKLAMAASALSALSAVGSGGRQALLQRAVSLTGEAVSDLASLGGRVGAMEKRVSEASDRLSAQADLLETRLQALESVDPYEASTRVSSLLQQIETSYALTARLQQLSLAQFLS